MLTMERAAELVAALARFDLHAALDLFCHCVLTLDLTPSGAKVFARMIEN